VSIGSVGIVGSVAGAPLAQAKGADVERNREAAANQQRQIHSETNAESAAGIGKTDGDNHETHDRDADGRMLYDYGLDRKPEDDEATPKDEAEPPHAVDPTGQAGSHLDLSG